MPCDSITTVTAELKGADLTLIIKALQALGYTPTRNGQVVSWEGGSYNQATGEIQTRSYGYRRQEASDMAANLKRRYALEVAKFQAQRFGWRVKEVNNKLHLSR